jgi:hypothetical protein
MPQDDKVYNQLKETWKNIIQEMFIHGDPNNKNVIAFRDSIWLLANDIPASLANEIYKKVGIDIKYNEDADFLDLANEIMNEKPDVLTGSINDKTLLVYSSGSFTLDPKSSILIKKVVQHLKLKKVDYQEMEDQFTVPKKKITGQVPDIAYHGTSLNYLDSILRHGLEPRGSQSNYEQQGIYHDDKIFFSTRFGEASHHADHTAALKQSKPVVIEFRIPDKNLITPDYDIDIQSGETLWSDTRDSKSKLTNPKSQSASQEFGIYGYQGKIIPQHFRYFYINLSGDEYSTLKSYKRFTYKQLQKIINRYGDLESYLDYY